MPTFSTFILYFTVTIAFSLSVQFIINRYRIDRFDVNYSIPCFDVNSNYCSQINKHHCQDLPYLKIMNCLQTCDLCHLKDRYKRCDRSFLNISEASVKSGYMNEIFEKIMKRGKEFEPIVLNQPPNGPWVIMFDNFISSEEINAFLKWGNYYKFQSSETVGNIYSDIRTSESTWCFDRCNSDPRILNLTERIEYLLEIDRKYYELYQLIRYFPGQYYKVHNDMLEKPEHKIIGPGPRVLTLLFYFNDVKKGGETNFPQLELQIAPKKGRMIIWSSVINDDIFVMDNRTEHESLEVIEEMKYASNLWIHSHNWKVSYQWNCA